MARPKKAETTKVAKEKVIEQTKKEKPNVEKIITDSLNKVENFLYNKIHRTSGYIYDELIEIKSRIETTQWLIIIMALVLGIVFDLTINKLNNNFEKQIDTIAEEVSILSSDVSDIYTSTYEIQNYLMPVDENNCIQGADGNLYCKK